MVIFGAAAAFILSFGADGEFHNFTFLVLELIRWSLSLCVSLGCHRMCGSVASLRFRSFSQICAAVAVLLLMDSGHVHEKNMVVL